jgi:type IV pilus assembly protein PilW
MTSTPARPIEPWARPQRGFTLIELMIAVLLALFLSAGLLTLVQAMKATAGVQSGLSQLQDSERMAMTLIADVIQSAGYFPNPVLNQAALEFPVTAPFGFAGQTSAFTAAGQSVVGAGNYGDPPLPANPSNSITVRYASAGTVAVPPASPDNIINCTGNASTVATTFTNTFSLLPDPSIPGTYDLVCQLSDSAAGTTNTVYLVSGVKQMQIYYGVQTNGGVTTGSVDTYLDANAVTAGPYWNKVVSVKVTLTFVNPLYGSLAGQNTRPTTPQTIPFTRVIDVMNKAN